MMKISHSESASNHPKDYFIQLIKGGIMPQKPGHLANGCLIPPDSFDIEYQNNYYKKINNVWFIFGNQALYPLKDDSMTNENSIIIQLDYLLLIKEK